MSTYKRKVRSNIDSPLMYKNMMVLSGQMCNKKPNICNVDACHKMDFRHHLTVILKFF